MSYAADFRKKAREALRGNWALAIGTGFIATILGACSKWGGSSGGNSSGHEWRETDQFFNLDLGSFLFPFFIGLIAFISIWFLITLFFGGVIELGYCRFNKNLLNGKNPRFNDLFSRFDLFWKALGLRIVIAIFTFLWALLLIIPGIIAAFSYSMAFYILEEKPSLGILEAINQSKEMMRGNKWRLFCLVISFIGWFILCLFTFGVGFLWLIPYTNAAIAAFYLEISGSETNIYG